MFLVCGYNDRPDISEGLASVYLKFKQLRVPAPSINYQPSTINSAAIGIQKRITLKGYLI